MNQKTTSELRGTDETVNNTFINTLQEFREGESIAELSEALQALVCAVMETQKKGELIYRIRISPQGQAVVVSDKIEVKAPVPPRDAKIFFATEEGLLQRDNPEQRKLDFKEVHREEPEFKNVAPAKVQTA